MFKLTAPRIIDQFGRKRCQKKRKDASYQLISEFVQKYFVLLHELWAGKILFSTWICYTFDVLFWWAVYVVYCCENFSPQSILFPFLNIQCAFARGQNCAAVLFYFICTFFCTWSIQEQRRLMQCSPNTFSLHKSCLMALKLLKLNRLSQATCNVLHKSFL